RQSRRTTLSDLATTAYLDTDPAFASSSPPNVRVRLVVWMAFRAMRRCRVARRERSTSQEVLSSGRGFAMIWSHTSAMQTRQATGACRIEIVALMVEVESVRNGSVRFFPCAAVGQATAPPTAYAVSVCVESLCPHPAPIGLGRFGDGTPEAIV